MLVPEKKACSALKQHLLQCSSLQSPDHSSAETVFRGSRYALHGRYVRAGEGNELWSNVQNHLGWSPGSPAPQEAVLCNGASVRKTKQQGKAQVESPSLPVQGVFSCTSNLLACWVCICRNFTLFLIALRRSRTEPPLYDLNFRRSAKEINVCFDAGSCSCWPQKKCMFMRCSYIEWDASHDLNKCCGDKEKLPELRPCPFLSVQTGDNRELPAVLTRHHLLPVWRGTVMCSLQSIFTTSLPPLSNCLTIGPSKASFSIRSLTSWKRHSSYFQLFQITASGLLIMEVILLWDKYYARNNAWDEDGEIQSQRTICQKLYFFSIQWLKRLEGTSGPHPVPTPCLIHTFTTAVYSVHKNWLGNMLSCIVSPQTCTK